MSACEDADACKKTGKWLCNCKQSKNHPGTCCMKSGPLSVIHCLSCTAIICSNKPYEIAELENRLDPSWEETDPCYDDHGHCCGFLYHTIVCSLCLPFMVLGLISGTVCYCVGCWNGCCGCDDCCKSKVGPVDQPIAAQPHGGQNVWTTDQPGRWD